MNKMIKVATMVVSVGAMLCIAGCGLSKEDIQNSAAEVVLESLNENLKNSEMEFTRDFSVDSTENCVLVKKDDHSYTGTIDVWIRYKDGDKIKVKYSVDVDVDGENIMVTSNSMEEGRFESFVMKKIGE